MKKPPSEKDQFKQSERENLSKRLLSLIHFLNDDSVNQSKINLCLDKLNQLNKEIDSKTLSEAEVELRLNQLNDSYSKLMKSLTDSDFAKKKRQRYKRKLLENQKWDIRGCTGEVPQ